MKIFFCFFFLCSQAFALPNWNIKYSLDDTFSQKNPFILLDFKRKEFINSIGADFGAFDLNPYDKEAYCRISLVKDPDDPAVRILKILYDVESKDPAFNGFWTKLHGLDLSGFEAVSIFIRGMEGKEFSDFFKIELKDNKTKMQTDVKDITSQWKKIIIPFDEFQSENEPLDMKNLQEFTMVFEDWRLVEKVGGYEIKEIGFIPKKGVTIKWKDMVRNLIGEQEQSEIKMVVQEKKEEILVNIIDEKKKLFERNKISRDGKVVLNKVVDLVKKESYKRVIIMMYPSRTKETPAPLSEKQARAILFYLTSHGLDYKKIGYRILSSEETRDKIDILIIRWKEGEEDKYKYYFYMGLDAYIKENYKEALRQWNEALKFDQDNVDLKAWVQKAEIGQKKKK